MLRGFALILICALAVSASEWRLSQLNRKVWQLEDGLPHNYVTAIARDDMGYLLLGTQAGISRFDGMRFTPFEHLGPSWIYSLLKASDGTLWVGGYQSGLHAIRDGKTKSWSGADGIREGTVFSLLEDRRHTIWLVSPDGLMRMDGSVPRMVVRGADVDGYAWQSMTEDDSGSVWFAAREGLFRVSGNEVTQLRLTGASGLPATIYYSPGSRQLYIGTSVGLYALNCSSGSCASTAIPAVKGPVVGLRTTAGGALWVATWGYGIYRVESGLVEHISTREGLPDDFVRALSEDDERNLWAGTRSGGLTRFRETPLKPFGIPEGLGGNYASAVIGDGADGLWLGTWRSGLFHWRNGRVTPQPLSEPVLGILINSLAIDSHRDLWMGTFHGLWKIDSKRHTAAHVRLPDDNGNVTHVLITRSRELWLAMSGAGLLRYRSGDPRSSSPESLLRGQTVTALLEDSEGRIWIGAKSGLWAISPGRERQPELLGTDGVTAMAQDPQQRVWVATSGGNIDLYTKAGTRRIAVTGLPASPVYLIAAGDHSGIWFGTGRGLARAAWPDVDRFLTGASARIGLSAYGTSEGMRTIECRTGVEPSSWKSPDGGLWFPTTKGFVAYTADPDPQLPPPLPSIEQVWVDGKPAGRGTPILLSPGAHELAVTFTGIRLSRAERVQFRYRMEGLDEGWLETGTERLERYGHLNPGQFHLLVSARDPNGPWSDPVSSPLIEQAPFWYQSFWFRACALTLLALTTVLLYRYRLHRIRKGYTAVLEERNRIAREWHDTLLAGLSAASWQLDVAAQQSAQTPAARSIQSALGMVRYCRDEARRAIGDLRHDPVVEMSLAESMRDAIAQLTEGCSIRSRIEIDNKLPVCGTELNLDLLRICQEATVNAIQHARASELVVRLDCANSSISLSVQDDGIGMNSAWVEHPPHGHYGLIGMRERARRFGGNLYVSSEPGRGTTVKAVIPIQS